MGRTSIEWVKGSDGSQGFSWNALRAKRKEGGRPETTANHCETVNEACRFCYAGRMNPRLGGLPFKPGHRKDYDFIVDQDTLLAPLHRQKPARYFVESMSDAFGEWWPRDFVDQLYAVMLLSPHHTFINLSKRPHRRRDYLAAKDQPARVGRLAGDMIGKTGHWDVGTKLVSPYIQAPLPNVIEGVSVSCQTEVDEFCPVLLETRCHRRAVSAEPLIGPIDFTAHFGPVPFQPPGIDWVITGGESGRATNIRPMNPRWAEAIQRQCATADVAYHHKQNGEFAECTHGAWRGHVHRFEDGTRVARVGKKAAGRLLGGKEHDGFPTL